MSLVSTKFEVRSKNIEAESSKLEAGRKRQEVVLVIEPVETAIGYEFFLIRPFRQAQ